MLRRVTLTIGLFACFFSALSVARGAELDELSKWIPAASNSIAIVRVRSLLESPHGKRQKWAAEQREAYTAGLVSTPPGVELAVRATEVRTGGGEKPATYTLYRMLNDDQVRMLAMRDKVQVDKVQELVAFRSPRGPYFVQLTKKLVGSVIPADRQILSRWLRSSANPPPPAADSFLNQVLMSDDPDQVVIAVDLTDMIDFDSASQWIGSLPKSPELSDVRGLATLFSQCQGMRLSVYVDNTITCQLKLSFHRQVGSYAPGVEKIVLAWMAETGARIDQFDAPDTSSQGNTVTLKVAVDDEALRRVISLIQTPHSDTANHPVEAATGPGEALPSRAYFQGVNKLVDNLARQNRKANDYNQTAVWHENFARKIGELPLTGVDPELAQWGKSVSDHLLALAQSLRGTPIEVNKLERKIRVHTSISAYRYASTPYADLYRPGWINASSNLSDVRGAQYEAIMDGNDKRDEIWNMIDEDRTNIQTKMEDKFKIPFGKDKK